MFSFQRGTKPKSIFENQEDEEDRSSSPDIEQPATPTRSSKRTARSRANSESIDDDSKQKTPKKKNAAVNEAGTSKQSRSVTV